MPSALDDLTSPELDNPNRRFGDTLTSSQTNLTDVAQPDHPRQRAQINRIRAADMADRGIPTYRDEVGTVKALTDETGAALSGFDSRHGIAYDSSGQPKRISYGETGPPRLSDPFADLPNRVDESTGAIEKRGLGLYRYEGQDPVVTQQLAIKEKDKAISREAALVGRKLTLDEHDLVTGQHEHDKLKKDLVESVPTLLDPKYEGADPDTVKKAIEDHFNSEYAAPEANHTAGWFGSELSPEATARRADIDRRKEAAMQTAATVFGLKEELGGLHETVKGARETERAQIETLLAHSRGEEGPLDLESKSPNGGLKPAEGLYPPETDQPRMLGGQPLEPDRIAKAPVKAVTQFVKDGEVPQSIAAASLAASHDAEDAMKKAKELETSNPTLAEQFKNIGGNIVRSLSMGIGEILKSATNEAGWDMAINPLHQIGTASQYFNSVVHGIPMEKARELMKADIEKIFDKPTRGLVDEKLADTVGAKVGSFIGGIAPYVGMALATKGTSVGAPLMATMFYNSGYQRTYDDAKEKGADEDTAQGAAIGVGAINAILALPLRTVGKAMEAVFGDTAPKIVERQIKNAYEAGGAQGVYKILGEMATYLKEGRAGAYTSQAKKEVGEALESLMKEIAKPAAQRVLDVAKTVAGHAALGAGVTTAENLVVNKTYDPERGTFEGVPEQAIGFGLLGGLSKGFEQAAAARKAKQALDIINRGKTPPAAEPPALPGPTEPKPPAPTAREAPKAPSGAFTEKPTVKITPAEKVVTGKVVEPSKSANVADLKTVDIKAAEKSYLEQGGHADKLDAQNKLVALREAFPDPAARIEAIQKHLAPTVTPNDFKPALKTDEGVIPGEKGQTHNDIYKVQADPVASRAGDPEHGFVDQSGKFHTRAQVSTALGEKLPMQSERLRELQKSGEKAPSGASDSKSSTQVNLPAESAKPIHAFVKTIAEGDLYKGEKGSDSFGGGGYGRETEPHVTALYGITHNDVGAITARIKGHGPVALTLGKISKFSSPDEPYDVLKVDVHSPDLHLLNSTLKKEPFESDFPKYVPHLTLAYVKKGAADKYVGDTRFKGQTVTIPHLTFSDSAGVKTKIELSASRSSLEEQTVGKLAMGAMAKHKETLTNLSHSTIPKLGTTDSESGIQAKSEDGKDGKVVITIDAKKLAANTAQLDERGKSKYIQRAIEEEVLHVAALKWEKQAPDNAGRLTEWGGEKDELTKHLEDSYEGWEDLSDRQKGHEKLRAVLQKRWTGKLTEAAYRVLKEFLKYLRGIYEKLTPGQREIVDGVEAILKGRVEEKAPVSGTVEKTEPQPSKKTTTKLQPPETRQEPSPEPAPATTVAEKVTVMVHEIDKDGNLVLRPNEPSMDLLRDYTKTAALLKQLLDCLSK